jgi:hypothetical protein
MFQMVTRRSRFGCFAAAPLFFVAACGPAEKDGPPGAREPIDDVALELGQTTGQYTPCDFVGAGGGWKNTFMPISHSTFTTTFLAYPYSPDTPSPIDVVVGFSDGPADAFTDLGPIVRFNASGYIDARDGNAYVGAFPYRTDVGPFEFLLNVNIPDRTYNVWVRHADSPNKPFEVLGLDLRFRTEQSNMTRIDTIARFSDLDEGGLSTCYVEYASPDECQRSTEPGTWRNRHFPSFPDATGRIRVEFVATTSERSIDAVVGLSNGPADAFTDLAPIARFRPDGTFDARNGRSYATQAAIRYESGLYYKFGLDIDVRNGTYSAEVQKLYSGQPSLVFAQNFAFRTEQAGVPFLDHLAFFVDGTPGWFDVCKLTVAY